MVAVITWCVETRVVKQSSAGFVSALGNLTALLGESASPLINACVFIYFELTCTYHTDYRYNCNRYNEDDAKAARDAQEVF